MVKNINKIFEKNVIYDYALSEIKLEDNVIEGDIEAKMVVFYNTEESELPEGQKAFLMKMLGAVKHNLQNTLLISDKANISFKQIVKAGFANKIMLFGSSRKMISLNLLLKRYKIFKIHNIDILFIDKLETIQEDQKRKGALWSLMKNLFKID